MILTALRVVAQHRESRCEQCTEDGCPAFDRARALVLTPGEW